MNWLAKVREIVPIAMFILEWVAGMFRGVEQDGEEKAKAIDRAVDLLTSREDVPDDAVAQVKAILVPERDRKSHIRVALEEGEQSLKAKALEGLKSA